MVARLSAPVFVLNCEKMLEIVQHDAPRRNKRRLRAHIKCNKEEYIPASQGIKGSQVIVKKVKRK